ncbi:MAG TPA: hypothetical protein VE035_11425 [Puia sp.]|nr:hypothetical protein [Puia sp.]
MSVALRKSERKSIQTPETVSGVCMTGKIMSKAEVIKVSSYIIKYKTKKASATKNSIIPFVS